MKIAALLLFMSISTAQSAEPTGTLTLGCNGTMTNWGMTDLEKDIVPQKPKPEQSRQVSPGIVVDFAAGKVVFADEDYPAQIKQITETTISFSGEKEANHILENIDGSIDRVTGSVSTTIIWQIKDKDGYWTNEVRWTYELQCKPMQRMF